MPRKCCSCLISWVGGQFFISVAWSAVGLLLSLKSCVQMRSLSSETLEGDAVWASPWERWAAFPQGGKAVWNRTAIWSSQMGQAKCVSNNQRVHQSRCRHLVCLKCPGGLAWAGWQEHWHIWVFGIWSLMLQTEPRWGGNRCEVPPHRGDKA